MCAPAMLDREVETFLKANSRAFYVMTRKHGHPTVHPLSALYPKESLDFTTYRKSAKALKLARDSELACLVTTPDSDEAFRAVLIQGTDEMMPPGAEMPRGSGHLQRAGQLLGRFRGQPRTR